MFSDRLVCRCQGSALFAVSSLCLIGQVGTSQQQSRFSHASRFGHSTIINGCARNIMMVDWRGGSEHTLLCLVIEAHMR